MTACMTCARHKAHVTRAMNDLKAIAYKAQRWAANPDTVAMIPARKTAVTKAKQLLEEHLAECDVPA